jgi:hypothetical protein
MAAAGSPVRPTPADDAGTVPSEGRAPSLEAAFARAAQCVLRGAHGDAANIVDNALADAPAGNAGWLLPIEPMLGVGAHPDAWTRPLARLRNRAA